MAVEEPILEPKKFLVEVLVLQLAVMFANGLAWNQALE